MSEWNCGIDREREMGYCDKQELAGRAMQGGMAAGTLLLARYWRHSEFGIYQFCR